MKFPEFIENLPRELPEIEIRPLDRSYRSSPVIIETVNRVFQTLPQNAVFEMGGDSGDRDIARQAAQAFASAFQPHDTARRELDGYCVLMSKEAAATGIRPHEDADEAENAAPDETARLMIYAARQMRAVARGGLTRSGTRPQGKRARQLRILQGLPRVGPERAARLLERFGTVERIMTATESQLKEVEGVGRRTADAIRWAVSDPEAAYEAAEL